MATAVIPSVYVKVSNARQCRTEEIAEECRHEHRELRFKACSIPLAMTDADACGADRMAARHRTDPSNGRFEVRITADFVDFSRSSALSRRLQLRFRLLADMKAVLSGVVGWLAEFRCQTRPTAVPEKAEAGNT